MRLALPVFLVAALTAAAQQPTSAPPADPEPKSLQQPAPTPNDGSGSWRKVDEPPAAGPSAAAKVRVEPGTRIPLTLINSISSRSAAEGDRVYLETAFPVIVDARVVIPAGSYVAGTVTSVKRAGRVKGLGEIFVRFDTLTLPNGVTRDFRATISQVDDMSSQKLDKQEGKITSEGNKGGDMRTIGEAAGAGASVGSIAGAVGGNTGKGLGIGAAAGAAAGLIGVMVSRGPEAVLAKGTTVEMLLDRPVLFDPNELDFGNSATGMRRSVVDSGNAQQQQRNRNNNTGIRRFPW